MLSSDDDYVGLPMEPLCFRKCCSEAQQGLPAICSDNRHQPGRRWFLISWYSTCREVKPTFLSPGRLSEPGTYVYLCFVSSWSTPSTNLIPSLAGYGSTNAMPGSITHQIRRSRRLPWDGSAAQRRFGHPKRPPCPRLSSESAGL